MSLDLFETKKYLYEYFPNLELRKYVFSKKKLENLHNDYNVKFLPDTQFLRFDSKIINLEINPNIKNIKNIKKKDRWTNFYIEVVNDEIWTIDAFGIINQINLDDSKNYKKEIKSNFNQNRNLDTFHEDNLSNIYPTILDTLLFKEKIYISYVDRENGCGKYKIVDAKINNENLNFKNFYTSIECSEKLVLGGKMQPYQHQGVGGILFTTGDVKTDVTDDKPQSDNSIFGKILFINFDNKKSIIFSKGHRNPQGLYVEGNFIISTEHGPRGGDEINNIKFNKNYGWPIASYGHRYGLDPSLSNTNPTLTYKINHKEYGFEEPIFSFIPSIGIAEIIKIPNTFSKNWQNNFLVASLYDKSIYRIEFENNFSRIKYTEKIFIGQRIRDLKYHNKLNAIILSLQEKGELQIIKANK